MSLLCGECDRHIIYGEPLHLAVCDSSRCGVAICATCLEQILRAPVSADHSDVVTIHAATSTRNFNGSYTCGGLDRGQPQWWVPASEVRTRLPTLAAMCGLIEAAPTRRRGLEVEIFVVAAPPSGPKSRRRTRGTRAERDRAERDARVEELYQTFRRGGFRL